jgi:uncharacterized protein YndB with AHSA1/START domain
MADIRHRVTIAASPDQVYEAIATRDGLRRWWTPTVDGDDRHGGRLRFFFGSPEPSATMEVLDLTPNQRVAWRCVQGPDEWMNTGVDFEVKADAAKTVLMFTHAGWQEPVEFMHHCSTKWAYYLLGLKSGLEGGRATPHPEGQTI